MLALSMITNDAERTIALLEKYGQYFDKWYITAAEPKKKEFYKLKKYIAAHRENGAEHQTSFFQWCDNFGKAREYNRQQIQEDFFFWMDSDDEIDHPERLEEAVTYMKQEGLDAMYFEYKYMQNDLGEEIAPHWRERIIRTNSMFTWAQNRCHETLIAPNAKTLKWDGVKILHNKTKEDEEKSMLRNIELLKLDFKETKDPRTAMYLGDNLMYLKQFDEAMECFVFLLQNGGWAEDKYRAWLRVAEIKYQLESYGEALDALAAAEDLLPEFPDSYFLKASVYNAMNEPKKTFEWVKVGMMKPVPDTMSVTDPTLYEYRGIFMGALAALELGKVDEAYKLFQIVRRRSPNYPLAKEMQPLFEEAYYDSEAIKKIKWLLYYSKDNGGDVGRLLSGLPGRLVSDPRLNADRAKLLPKRKWPAGSIVFYCGRSTEAWGPDTLGKGMGGSEEAIVYLTRELSKLGWQVTVYNDREEEYVDIVRTSDVIVPDIKHENDYLFRPDGVYKIGNKPNELNVLTIDQPVVTYKPWTLLNPYDEYDVFVAWRAPSATTGVKARIKAVDMHDTPTGHQFITPQDIENTDLFFLKSDYQWKMSATPIPKEKVVIVGNGIKGSHFGWDISSSVDSVKSPTTQETATGAEEQE